jgi:hypothetical protein
MGGSASEKTTYLRLFLVPSQKDAKIFMLDLIAPFSGMVKGGQIRPSIRLLSACDRYHRLR